MRRVAVTRRDSRVLEFYSVRSFHFGRIPLSNTRSIPFESPAMRNATRMLAMVAVAVFYGRAQPPSRQIPTPAAPPKPAAKAPTPRTAEPAPPNVNLSGFPLPYRQGYADGCGSVSGAERK